MRVKPTALLGSREQQPIEGMTSLATNFKMHPYGQRYGQEHLRPVNAVTYLFGDGDLDLGHCKMKVSAAKEFVARKKPRGDRGLSQAQEHQLEVIALNKVLDKSQVEAKAMTSRVHELTHTIPPGKAQETYWDTIKFKNCLLEILWELSKDKQQSTLIHKFGNPLRIPCPRCTVQT
jgi:hypothetical protein